LNVPQLRLDFTSIASKESEKPLRPAVNHVNLVERDCVDDLFAFLDLAVGALDEFCLAARSFSYIRVGGT